ncbi:FtsK/SpoIIIE domain-containing protein [Streptomyces sp. NPDC059740]|uniref:FtsK/SpoIIIE domain-containing protein n=1 Tax=Streptomyces sp. NPDC059740 TaxID=3346926 RepID=UPI003665F648
MQIRLTVLGPRGDQCVRARDVLVTAPAGTALAAVTGGLVAALAGSGPDTRNAGTTGAVPVYAGTERLDPQRCSLGEPPLLDGAVLSLHSPGPAPAHGLPAGPRGLALLRVVAGPDAGGVHLLHGGRVTVGRSVDADVPLDDPDVSRLHCAVTVGPAPAGGAPEAAPLVSVCDLGSTNGTSVDGVPVGEEPVPVAPASLLRVGESVLTVSLLDAEPALTLPETIAGARAAADGPGRVTPDGEGFLRVAGASSGGGGMAAGDGPDGPTVHVLGSGFAPPGRSAGARADSLVPHPPAALAAGAPAAPPAADAPAAHPAGHDGRDAAGGGDRWAAGGADPAATGRRGTPLRGTPVPEDLAPGPAADVPGARVPSQATHGGGRRLAPPEPAARSYRRGGIGAWARRFTGGRPAADAAGAPGEPGGPTAAGLPTAAPVDLTRWPDAATVLLTALGPGPRLWERGPGHPDALVVRLGTAGPPAAHPGTVAAQAVPVTVDLRHSGSLGVAGPRERLTATARSVLAQLAALHSPTDLEVVLVATDRARGGEERVADWSWLGWLPHTRPERGQDCRLLLALDREQAAARAAELERRLADGPLGPGWAGADRAAVAAAAARHRGPRTVVVVDGDPGTAALRQTLAQLAFGGSGAGVHVLCLAETPAASAAFPLAATLEAARTASLPFGSCGAVAVLSGDVATAVRVVAADGSPEGTFATVDAVSAAWADRFGRAMAPLRSREGTAPGGPRTPRARLPESVRLLEELGLARATPASLTARWAAAADEPAGTGALVLGAGPYGPLGLEPVVDGAPVLVTGGTSTGKTELLRSLAASLAAADHPERLGIVLVDGHGRERGEGLEPCEELPHVVARMTASDPVLMREFAQALTAELRRRAEVLAGVPFSGAVPSPVGRVVAPRKPADEAARAAARAGALRMPAGGGGTPPEGGERPDPAALPRLFVLVDDFDALVAPALGSTGRPSAGSVVRALEAVARDGAMLGVHLVAATGHPERTAHTVTATTAAWEVALGVSEGDEVGQEPAGAGRAGALPPGRGVLRRRGGEAAEAAVPFQAGRVTGRIPRTATLRPTVVPLEWQRMGDPPARRPLRELGNGPTDLALLASAVSRAAR